MSGRFALSHRTARKVATSLGMTIDETTVFCDLVDLEHPRNERVRIDAAARLAERQAEGGNLAFQELKDEEFKLISEWHHLAILEALDLDGAIGTAPWLARHLPLSVVEIAAALRRLEHLGLVAAEDGVFTRTKSRVATSTEVPSTAIRQHHQQVLALAADAVEGQNVQRRSLNSLMIGIERARLPAAFARLHAFVREFDAEFGDQENALATKDAVYCLAMQLFELTKGGES